MNQFLEKLNQLNIKLILNNDNLDIKAPKGAVTTVILEEIKNNKIELVSYLKSLTPVQSIVKTAVCDHYPLSSAQKRLWLIDQMNPENTAYNIPVLFEIQGNITVQKMQKTFESLLKRHESLRTIFRVDNDGNPVQIIIDIEDIPLFKIDYKEIFQEKLYQKEIESFVTKSFDLSKDFLLRVTLIKIAEDKHLLLIAMHHIISDGWSIEILAQDFFKIYSNPDNDANHLEKLSIQYKDYAVWQQGTGTSEEIIKAKEYWLSVFSDEIPVLELPSYKKRPKYRTGNGKTLSFEFDRQKLSKISDLCSQNKATLFMGIKSLVDILLFKYSRQNDFTIGTPIANREYFELENQIGFYANTLALRTRIESDKTFLEVLNYNRSQLLEAYKNQSYPFDELVFNLNLQSDLSRNPLFDIMISLQGKSDSGISNLDNLIFKKVDFKDQTSKFDLLFNFYVEEGKLLLDLTYNSDIYDDFFANKAAKHLNAILEQVVLFPDTTVNKIDILTQTERDELLYEFNNNKAEYPTDKTIIDLFEEQVKKSPESIAIVFEDISLSYKELNEQANQLGYFLRLNHNIEPEDLILIKLGRSEKLVLTILGILKSGAAYVPVDPAFPEERIAYMTNDTKAKLTIDDAFLAMFETVKKDYSTENIISITKAENLAYVMYTSGTTGQPKGVMIENKSFINLLCTYNPRFEVHNTALTCNYNFDVSVLEIFNAILSGSKLFIPTYETILSPLDYARYIIKNKITSCYIHPMHLEIIGTELNNSGYDQIKKLLIGVEPIPYRLIEFFLKTAEVINGYGPTENTIWSTFFKIDEKPNTPFLPIGQAVANTQGYVLDENLSLVPIGVSGKLFLSGSGLSRGYLNKPELSEQKFINNPFAENTKMYDSGDIVRWLPDGNIEFIGREDFQVKIRGYRIELGEIETHSLGYSIDIVQVVADAKKINDDKVLVLYYTTNKKDAINKTELRDYLATKLPEYMVPGFFVELDAIPLTANGKIFRRGLPEVKEQDVIKKEYSAPRNKTEQQLANIWEEVLSVDQIGLNDNFFELGGNSLKLISLSNKYRQVFNADIAISKLYKNADITKHIKLIQDGSENNFEIKKVSNQPYYPVTPTQKSMWEIDKYVNSKVFQLSFFEEINIDVVLFKKAYELIVDQYEVFRTTFKEDEEGRVQQWLNNKTNSISKIIEIDYSQKNDPYQFITQYLDDDKNTRFDLAAGPLFKCILFKISENKFFLYFSIHHIICDGLSLGILKKKLFHYYTLLSKGQEIVANDLAWQFKDYVTIMYQNKMHEKHQDYWKEKFRSGDVIPKLELTFAGKRPVIKTYNGAAICNKIEKSVLKKLQNLTEKTNSTLYSNLLTIISLALYKNSLQKEIIIGCPISGRESSDLENQIGCFVNTVPLKINIEDDFKYSDLLNKVRNDIFESFENSFFSLESLKKDIGYVTSPSRSSFFDVSVILLEDLDTEYTFTPNQLFSDPFVQNEQNKYDLSFNFLVRGDELLCNLDYNTDIFSKESIESFFNEIIFLIQNIQIADSVATCIDSITDESVTKEHNNFLKSLNNIIDTDF
ncbi:hypothetical protein ASF10_21410 [Flavobacterium sp. Leaf82]|uniref:non-ribosomal peptide synthetase n=1 Tax=unclassified Flavobacterium TaxID=196869 RepID=UPI0006FE5F22|nr:non-ribosomal peptide synthetase [Flavobacterium sp. Leaf82]KQO32137.1 hypothetical protein ASF10_21410 [Flavobacterium sp. Leaf82]